MSRGKNPEREMNLLTLEIESVAPASVAAGVGASGVIGLLVTERFTEAAIMIAFTVSIVVLPADE